MGRFVRDRVPRSDQVVLSRATWIGTGWSYQYEIVLWGLVPVMPHFSTKTPASPFWEVRRFSLARIYQQVRVSYYNGCNRSLDWTSLIKKQQRVIYFKFTIYFSIYFFYQKILIIQNFRVFSVFFRGSTWF